MTEIAFAAEDYRADQTFASAQYRYVGDAATGWLVERDGAPLLRLGPGYRLLRVRACGVCSTDLARHHLPFPLPQVIGHEVIATDDQGRRFVVEINASHHARGVASDCAFCRAGLPTHCPERLTLGIHGLPGGFGPWMLVPEHACLEVPANVPDSAAVLVEPFAAALHAVQTLAPQGNQVAIGSGLKAGETIVTAGVHLLKPGQKVTLTPSGGEQVAGTLRVVSPAVNTQTRNGLVYVDIPAAGSAKSGMFARGEIEIGSGGQALTLPQAAVQQRDGFNYVMRVGGDSKVVQTKVALGRRAGDRVEVLQGLTADAKVVATGGGFLGDGDLVQVVSSVKGSSKTSTPAAQPRN